MDIKSKQALKPFATLSLDQSLSENEILDKIEENHGRIFLLPKPPILTPPQLKPFIDIENGAKLLVRKDEVRAPIISRILRDSYIDQFKEKVFMQGYSFRFSNFFLQRGASLLIDGDDNADGMLAERVKQLCNSAKGNSKVKVSHYKFSNPKLKALLNQQVPLVFTCFPEMECRVPLIKDCIAEAADQVFISASNFAISDLTFFLKNGATVVITGADKLPFNVIKDLALEGPKVDAPADSKLKILIELELEKHRPDLSILQTDGRLEIIDNMNWYFSD